MKDIYTWGARPARRTLTVAGLQASKGGTKPVQVTANTADEAGPTLLLPASTW
jgi:3-methyl-2-oxobutanoate hydroxymethyltransferase